jgi:nucleoporin NUP159
MSFLLFFQLKELRDEVSTRYNRLIKAAGGSRVRAELDDRSKWGIADAMTFRQTALQLEDSLEELSNIRETFKQTLRELNGNMLRGQYDSFTLQTKVLTSR